MKANLRRKLIGGVAGLALLAGGGGAYALAQGGSGSGSDERDAFKSDVAKRLNVTPDQLDKAIEDATKARLDAAVKAGRLTQEQADEILKRMKEHGGPPFGFGGPPGPGGPGMHRGPGPEFGVGIDAAAKYLGLTRAQLRKRIESGKSLAQVAKAEGKPVDGLKSAIKDAITDDLDKAVADKRITEEQRKHMLEELDEHLDELVNAKPGRHRHGHRHGRFGGPPPGPPGFGPPPPPRTP